MRELSIFIDESGDFGPYEKHYSLFRAADLCCTLTLLEAKIASVGLSASERDFFSTKKNNAERSLRRGYFRTLAAKKFAR